MATRDRVRPDLLRAEQEVNPGSTVKISTPEAKAYCSLPGVLDSKPIKAGGTHAVVLDTKKAQANFPPFPACPAPFGVWIAGTETVKPARTLREAKKQMKELAA